MMQINCQSSSQTERHVSQLVAFSKIDKDEERKKECLNYRKEFKELI